ncbi:hypothetical protein [uncultured Mailhella sp.]|uniref:PglD-related sugar-binding protein n=1 Tax=uncultured Mailhella sp. TaxID=1981031 RepID=UPI002638D864|nr:hypothetical protein [uncultured Mailhella sp.]
MKDLYIVGAGGCGREVLSQILDMQAAQGPRWNIKGFLDDTEDPLKGKACDYPVVGTIRDYMPAPNDVLLMCIASPQAKQKLVPMLKARGAVFDSFISPWSFLGRHNHIGEGAIVYGGFSMSVNCTIGNFATLLYCTFGHDVEIGDYCTVSSSCGLLGYVKAGKGVYMGDGVRVAPHVEIGDGAYLCMGSVVLKNVGAGAKVLGNPAREIG